MCVSPDEMNLAELERHLEQYQRLADNAVGPNKDYYERRVDAFRELITILEKNAAEAGVPPEEFNYKLTPRHDWQASNGESLY